VKLTAIPPALINVSAPVVFIDGHGVSSELALTPAARQARRVRVVVRASRNADPTSWYVSALAEAHAVRPWDSATGRVEISGDSVKVVRSGKSLRTHVERFSMPPTPTPTLLIVDMFGAQGDVIAQTAVELRWLASPSVLQAVRDYAVRSQAGGAVGPLLSIDRFLGALEPLSDLIVGQRVFVSGCGTGGELLALDAMGAATAVGSEVEGEVLDLASQLVAGSDRIRVVSALQAQSVMDADFDLALSRHVIEHLDASDRAAYVDHLVRSVHVGGHVLVEFPNQDCPIEPHTDLEFFHWLDSQQRARAVEYLTLRAQGSAYPAARAALLASFGDHRNLTVAEFRELIPRNASLASVRYFDSAFETSSTAASTVQCQLTRVG
jgi:SAM-dependent methyltransferase